MDFVSDCVRTGKVIRMLTIVDDCTRECPLLSLSFHWEVRLPMSVVSSPKIPCTVSWDKEWSYVTLTFWDRKGEAAKSFLTSRGSSAMV